MLLYRRSRRNAKEALYFRIYFKVPYVFNGQLRNLIVLFICINFLCLVGKDVTSRDSFFGIVAQTIHFRAVWSGTQARNLNISSRVFEQNTIKVSIFKRCWLVICTPRIVPFSRFCFVFNCLNVFLGFT